jgi:hypothetical protein
MASLKQSTVNNNRFGRDGSGGLLSAAFGAAALYGTAPCSVGVGYCAGVYNNARSAFVGVRAGRFNYSNDNVAVGYGTMVSSSGRYGTVAVGSRAHNSSAGGRFNQAVGALQSVIRQHGVQLLTLWLLSGHMLIVLTFVMLTL